MTHKETVSYSTAPAWRIIIISILILIGLACSIYLTHLYVLVHTSTGEIPDTFCSVNEQINCVSVANSPFSALLGIPISVYGLEYFLLCIALIILSVFSLWPVKKWESFIFWLSAMSLPVCALLWYVAKVLIQSICIMCIVVYLMNILIFLVLLISNIKSVKSLLLDGPKELISNFGRSLSVKMLAGIFLLVAVSQFFWMPVLFDFQKAGAAMIQWQGQQVNGAALGSPDAPLKIDEFTDFECPFCGKAHNVLMELANKYPDKIYLRHFDYPLDHKCNPYILRPFHKNACLAATYARCAANQNRFWHLEHFLFENREKLKKSDLDKYAYQAGLDKYTLNKCLDNSPVKKEILDDISEGKRRGMSGTPTFFVNDNEMIVGYKPIEFWEEKFLEILTGKKFEKQTEDQ